MISAMGRSHWHPTACKVCDRTQEEVGHISQTGLCFDCGCERSITNAMQLMAKTGPYFDRWRERVIAGVARTADTPD